MMIGVQLRDRTHRVIDMLWENCLGRIFVHPAPWGNRTEIGEAAPRPRRFSALLLRLALGVRHLGMLVSGLRVAVRPHRFFAALGVVPFAVMFGSHPVAFCRVVVMFGRFVMGVSRHGGSP